MIKRTKKIYLGAAAVGALAIMLLCAGMVLHGIQEIYSSKWTVRSGHHLDFTLIKNPNTVVYSKYSILHKGIDIVQQYNIPKAYYPEIKKRLQENDKLYEQLILYRMEAERLYYGMDHLKRKIAPY